MLLIVPSFKFNKVGDSNTSIIAVLKVVCPGPLSARQTYVPRSSCCILVRTKFPNIWVERFSGNDPPNFFHVTTGSGAH
jgi:hypothetical protein